MNAGHGGYCQRFFFVIFACTVLGWFLLFPKEYANFGRSAIAATAFFSNVWFYREQTDYFADLTDFSPLLHTWSLAVEEQFYVVVPLIFFLAMRLGGRKAALLASLVILGASVATSAIISAGQPEFAFYLPFTRAHELAIGAILALLPSFTMTRPVSNTIGTLGLLMILISAVYFNGETVFPGLAALVPCLGAAFLIAAGRQGSIANDLLSWRPLVFIGLISYSWYLWHWPLLAFARERIDSPHLPLTTALACVSASFLIAILSWRYIEQPFRRPDSLIKKRGAVFAACGLASTAAIALSVLIFSNGGLPYRYSPEVKALLEEQKYWHTDENLRCRNGPTGWSRICSHRDQQNNTSLDYMILGDSHGATLATGLTPQLRTLGLNGKLITMPGCPPVLGAVRITGKLNPYEMCSQHNEWLVQHLKAREDAPLIIVHARWAAHAEGVDRRGLAAAEPLRWTTTDVLPPDPARQFETFTNAVGNMMKAIAETGRHVVIIGSTPDIGWNVPRRMAGEIAHGARLPAVPDRKIYSANQLGRVDAFMARLSQTDKRVTYLSLVDILCPTQTCLVANPEPLYADSHHLSFYGAEFVAERLAPLVYKRPEPQG